MKMIFKAFAKKFFGTKYERAKKMFLVCLVLFWGLRIAEIWVAIAPHLFYLMVSIFTAGMMWQALSSEENAADMQNLFMLPLKRQDFILSYIAALGAYTCLTKTAGLLAVILAVSVWNGMEILGSVLCAIHAILMSACVYSLKKRRGVGILWAAVGIVAIFFLWEKPYFFPMMVMNGLLAFLLLQCADEYAFYSQAGNHILWKKRNGIRTYQHDSIWRYLLRYLKAHKNYQVNTMAMWGVACVLPVFFRGMESLFIVPIGFVILSLNTPICILLSCDPSFEQAIRFLPKQRKAFCVPYCLFIFFCNITADLIFLCSLQIQNGGVTGGMILIAVFFAMQSAICSVLLEWFYPIRGWKIESDLWHHPRKYIVPVIMILFAGIVGTVTWIRVLLMILLLLEIGGLLFLCWRY